jgi:hypothetical protein
MSDQYFVTADHGHLRIYRERLEPGQYTPGIEQVEGLDFPAGRASYTDREADQAGRYSSSKTQGPGPGIPMGRQGMSIDERLPMQREEERRLTRQIASEIDRFFQSRPEASWDFAAGPEINRAIVELLSPAVRKRMRRSIAKDLVNQRSDELRAHFVARP